MRNHESDRPETGDRQGSGDWPLFLRVVAVVVLAGVLATPFLLFREQIAAGFQSSEQVVREVRSAGVWGPVVIIGLAIVQTIVAPIPGQVINFVSSYIYGLWPGLLYSWIGLVLGTALAMGMARLAGRPLVERLIGRKQLDRLDGFAAKRGLGFFFLFFLIPGLPDDALCLVAGLTTLPIRLLILISAIARIPGLLGSAWLGANAHTLPWWAWVALGLASLASLYLVWRHGEKAQEAVVRWLNKM